MNAAKIENSQRLQRVLGLLVRSKKPLSTLQIIQKAQVCAVNSIISELRCAGYDIRCKRDGDKWFYLLNQ